MSGGVTAFGSTVIPTVVVAVCHCSCNRGEEADGSGNGFRDRGWNGEGGDRW